MRSTVLSYSLALIAVALLAVSGCTADDPATHYSAVVTAAESGDLSKAYAAAVPASYEKDLSEILSKAQSLVGEPEFEKIQGLVTKVAGGMKPMFEQLAAQDPSAKPVVDALSDLPKALGLESYSKFSKLDIAGFVQGLEDGFARPILSAADSKAKLGLVEFALVAETETGAKVKMTVTGPDGSKTEQEVELTKVEGKWVPAKMAAEWGTQIAQVKQQLDGFLAQKAADPEFLSKKLDEASQQIDQAMPMIGIMLRGVMAQMQAAGK